MNARMRTAILAGLCAASFGVAGCDSSSTGTGGSGGPAVTTAAASGGGQRAVQVKAACDLVSLTEAKSATGRTELTKAIDSEHFCSYQGSGSVDISVTPAPYAQASVDAQKKDMAVPTTDIAGLGDAAFVAKDSGGAGVGEAWVKGVDIEIRVESSAGDPVAAARSLLQTAAGHLPTA